MFRSFYMAAAVATCAFSQSYSPLNCVATAVPALVKTEGITERVGDIVMNCTGGTPNGLVRGDIRVISFTGNITNKIINGSNGLDAVITVDTGTGERSTGAIAVLTGPNQFEFAGLNFNLAADGKATFRITNVRLIPPATPDMPFQVAMATNGPSAIRIDNSPLVVGIATRGLLASYSSTFVCTVSPVPEVLLFDQFLRVGTRFASMRFTEGFGESFQKKGQYSDHGTRIALRFSGFPAGSRIFVPEMVVGSTGTIPTSAGDLGLPVNGGRYTPSAGGQLLLALVKNADANGAGGTVGYIPPPVGSPATDYSAMGEVTLTSGSGIAVFEVLDSNATTRETFQVPMFLALDSRPAGGSVTANVAASFGPISSEGFASSGPVPRFQAVTPPPDCQALGDCNSGIFPRLVVDSDALTYNVLIGQFAQTRFIRVRNDGGGLLNWTAAIAYKSGSGWLSLDPAYGIGPGTIRLDATAAGLQPGTYEATLTIDAGPLAGRQTANVTMVARNLEPNPLLPPEISSVAHGATFERSPLAPGTIATAFGNRLKGEAATVVTLNGVQARTFFTNDTQINFEIPATLPTSGTVTLIVNVDGRLSPARAVSLTAASPGIFQNAILNQDNSVNSASNPALSGSIVQAFLTGLPSSGPYSVRIHDYVVNDLLFAGPAPGFIGLQQVNAMIPRTLQSITSEMRVCAGSVCSAPREITVRQP